MLLLGKKSYRGKYHQKAVSLIKAGTRVGMMWVSGEKEVHCHVCGKDFSPPELETSGDAFGECTHCKTPFIFADPMRT